jgi:GDPmannose 4,6-dehydratase
MTLSLPLAPAFLRPAEVDALVGDSAHARSVTGWEPKVMTPELARIMVDADVKIVEFAGSRRIAGTNNV